MTDTERPQPPQATLFQQVRVFDGVEDKVSNPCDVLVVADPDSVSIRDGIVHRIETENSIPVDVETDTGDPVVNIRGMRVPVQVIDGGGTRVLMPV